MSVRAIARNLSLSASTVSLALRGSDKIAEETRLKVTREADRLGYRCDAKLREMMTRMRSAAVAGSPEACLGILARRPAAVPPAAFGFRARARAALASSAEERGYRLESFNIDELSPARLAAILDARGIEGLFCFAEDFAEAGLPEALSNVKVVALGGFCAGAAGYVAPDYFGDMAECCRVLGEGGFWRIGLALGPTLEREAAERYLGAFLSRQADGWQTPWMRASGSELEALARLERWIASERPQAVICGGVDRDLMAEAIRRVEEVAPCQAVFLDLEFGEGVGICRSAERLCRRAVAMLASAVSERSGRARGECRVELARGHWLGGEVASLVPAEASALGL